MPVVYRLGETIKAKPDEKFILKGGCLFMRKRYIPILVISALVLVLSLMSCKTVEAPAEYSITYILDGGAWRENRFIPSTYTSADSGYRIPDPEKTGYTFAGWTVYSAEGTIISRGTGNFEIDTSLATDLTLMASWNPVTYTISYDDTIVELHEPEPVVEIPEEPLFRTSYTVEDTDFLLPDPPAQAGLDFLGWKEKSDAMDPHTRYLVITSRARDYVFEAVWQYHTYSISYDLAGGTWDGDEPDTSFIATDGKIRIPAPVREDYDFLGWKVSGSDNEPSKHYFVDSSECSDIALEAVWETHRYSIRLLGTDMKGEKATLYYTILDEPFLLPVPEKDAYTFAGWYPDGSEEEPVVEYTVDPSAGGNLVFRAAWAPVVYHIEYELAGGYLPYDLENPDTYTIDTDTFTLIEPRKDNYVFLGWIISGDRELTLNNPLRIRRGTSGDIKLYAIFQWKDVGLGDVTSMQQMVPEVGKDNIPRPNWVVKVPEDDYWHYEKGYGKADSFYDSLTLATKKALLAVAEWYGTDACEYYYSDGTDSSDDLYVDTGARVRGREIAEYWEDSEGGVWVLLRVPAEYDDGDFFTIFDSYDDDFGDFDWSDDFEWSEDDFTALDEDMENIDLFSLITLLFGE